MRYTTAWPVLFCILLSGCAYIGEPLPPALKIPVAATDLSALQRGGKIYVNFTVPVLTMEGLTLEAPPSEDVRIGTVEPPQTLASREIDVSPWVGKEVVIGVNFRGPSGRISEWSNFVRLNIVSPLQQPKDLAAKTLQTGVQLEWTGSTKQYRVFRDDALLEVVEKTSYLDTSSGFGQPHSYQIQGIQDTAESDLSKALSITPEDVFPPEVPTEFIALAGVKSIELSWDASTDGDTAFYRIYRNGELIADKLDRTTFSDPNVKSEQTYQYTISAVDAKMNESSVTAPVEITFP